VAAFQRKSFSAVVSGGGGRQVFVTERCLDTDFEVFTKLLHHEGSVDALEYGLYQRWLAHLQASATPLSAIVYVDTSPKECAKRIAQRGREGEEQIPLRYLAALDKQQREWIGRGEVPCLHAATDAVAAVQVFIDGLSKGKVADTTRAPRPRGD